ncbi:hypothetical protein TK49_03925 [Ralstonia mannitolilytica]|nr:hypothetical protein TK49_03925 [Ralstonia mannitolilytica]
MLEQQPDEVIFAALWELEASVATALPRGALVSAAGAICGGYDVAAKWSMSTKRGNRQECTLAVHFSLTETKAYCRLHHPKREEICRQVSEWVCAQLELHAGELHADTGYDLRLTAPTPIFFDANDSIHVNRDDRAHDFSLYRGAPRPPLV